MKKIIIRSLVLFLILIALLFYILINKGFSLYLEEISINEVLLSEDTLSIDGTIDASAKSYRDYKYEIRDNIIYITIKGGIVTKKHPSGTINFKIEDNALDKVEKVYLKKGKSELQVYP